MPSMAAFATAGMAALWIAAAVAAGYIAVLATLYLMQRHILFRPDPARPIAALAAQPGLSELTLATSDGLALLAWFIAPRPGAPTILYLHGNAGHIGHRGDRLRRFATQGWGVLMVGYRGYGGNPGQPSEAGLIEDARAGLAALHARGIPSRAIVVWGESLGSGVATALASESDVAAVVLETPFTSIAAIARQRYPFAPVDLLLKDRFDSLGRIAAITAPIIILQGGQDTIVPPEMGRTLLQATRAPSALWLAPEGGHSNLAEFGMVERVAAFLRDHLGPGEEKQGSAGKGPGAL